MIGYIFKLGWKNIWRNRRRTLLTLLAVVIGLTSLVFVKSYFSGLISSSREDMIKSRIGHIKMVHKDFLRLEQMMPRSHLVTGLDRIREEVLAEIPGINMACERLKFHVLLSHGDDSEPAVVFGMKPGEADRTMNISRTMVQGDYYDDSGTNLVIGSQLAQKLSAQVGDELLLVTTDINYSSYALPFTIAGIFKSGYAEMDKHMVLLPIAKAREMLDCGDTAHEILLFLDEPANAPDIGRQIAAQLAQIGPGYEQDVTVIPWQEDDYIKALVPFIEDLSSQVESIFVILVGLIILNTMLMAVMERYHEIGILKALGFKNGEVRLLIAAEALFIGVIGSLVGATLGGIVSAITEKTGFDLAAMVGGGVLEKAEIPFAVAGTPIYPDLTAEIVVGALFFGIFASLLGVLYPLFKTSKMAPVDAFRTELKV